MRQFVVTAVTLPLLVAFAGYGLLGFIDPGGRGWVVPALLLLGALAVSAAGSWLCTRSRGVAFGVTAVLAVSGAAAYGLTRFDAEAAAAPFVFGLAFIRLTSSWFYSQAHDPVGHPLGWGGAVLLNTAGWLFIFLVLRHFVMRRRRVSANQG